MEELHKSKVARFPITVDAIIPTEKEFDLIPSNAAYFKWNYLRKIHSFDLVLLDFSGWNLANRQKNTNSLIRKRNET